MDGKVTINGKEYQLSPLRVKHLKEISSIIAEPTSGVYEGIQKWMPFLLYSLKCKNPEVNQDLLDEMTLNEFNSVWSEIIKISGVSMASKGEIQPAASTGASSTEGSALRPAGPTVM